MSRVSAPEPRFVIVPHRPRVRAFVLLGVAVWILSLLAAWHVSRERAVPGMERLRVEQAALREERNDLRGEIDGLRRELALARRAEQVASAANLELQESLRERDEEIAALRADVSFYERLVGGSAERRGLAVHSVQVRPGEDLSVRYAITLTQSLKKAGLTRGAVTLSLEGVLDGRLTELDWKALRQDADAAPQDFEFRYFQQLEGVIMLPESFTPQRLRVTLRSDGQPAEQVFAWRDIQPAAQGA